MRISILLIISICIALTAGADLFAQDRENVEQVARIYNQWDYAEDVVVVGDLAYVATGSSGLSIVNVSDPENPELIGYWDDNSGSARGGGRKQLGTLNKHCQVDTTVYMVIIGSYIRKEI